MLLVAGIGVFAWGLDLVIASATDRTNPDMVITVCRETAGSGSLYSPLNVHVAQDGSVEGEAEHKQDVIPPYSYAGVAEPGQNWTAQGSALWYRGCSQPGSAQSPGGASVVSTTQPAQSQAPSSVQPSAQPDAAVANNGGGMGGRISGIYLMVVGLIVSIVGVVVGLRPV